MPVDGDAVPARTADGPQPTGHTRRRFFDAFAALEADLKRRYLFVLMLGFASGLPYFLYFSTLSFRLAEAGVATSLIAFFAWIGLLQNAKFAWAPIFDRWQAPFIGAVLGRRLGWVAAAQTGVITGLLIIALSSPSQGLSALVTGSVLVAFWSASQDISIDAWRVETARDEQEQSLFATIHLWGYRGALVVGGGGALFIAGIAGWQSAYVAMALLLALILMALVLHAIQRSRQGTSAIARSSVMRRLGFGLSLALLIVGASAGLVAAAGLAVATLIDQAGVPFSREDVALAVTGLVFVPFCAAALIIPIIRRLARPPAAAQRPVTGAFVDFFWRYGWQALVLLAFVSLYRISDLVMAALSKAVYAHKGYAAAQVGIVDGSLGLLVTIAGVTVGGLLSVRWGLARTLWTGAALAVLGNAAFAWLSATPAETWRLITAISLDNFAGGFAATVFIVYLAGLTNPAFTGTQFALFTSFAFLVPQILAGTSGVVQEAVGYFWFFTYAAILGVPALLLVPLVIRIRGRSPSGPLGDNDNPHHGVSGRQVKGP